MKFFKLLLLSLGIAVSLHSCQQDLDFTSDDAQLKMNEQSIAKLKNTRSSIQKEYMPLDSIPEWAKQMMTDEEFNLWKTMSMRYKIDYSFLNTDLNEKQKEELYSTLNIICEKINNSTCEEKDWGYFVVQIMNRKKYSNIERLSKSESSGEQTSDPVTVYTARESDHAYVEAVAVFTTNKEGTEIEEVKDTHTYAGGDAAIRFDGKCTSGGFGPVAITINCSGRLTYKHAIFNSMSESFNESVTIKVLPN